MDIVGLGSSNVDYLGVIEDLPGWDGRTYLLSFDIQGGGNVATGMVAAAKLGADVGWIGQVGDDEFGRFIINDFHRYGINHSRIRVEQSGVFPQAIVLVHRTTGRRVLLPHRRNPPPLLLDDSDRAYICSARYLHLDNCFPEASCLATEWARASAVKVSLDAGYLTPQVEDVVRLTDILIVSERFAREFTGCDALRKALHDLSLFGAEITMVTRGPEGCIGLVDGHEFALPAFRVEVIDTTGAGDVFHGAFLYGLVQGWDAIRTARFASAVAAMKCTKLGGRAGIPTLPEVEKFLGKNAK
ncbi:MAG: carbohydrate kinase family protein [Candidatus Latescibacteria bacterium]|nr:carbohydrate kinase family protein [Candidatus Latescibacterota bacterium]